MGLVVGEEKTRLGENRVFLEVVLEIEDEHPCHPAVAVDEMGNPAQRLGHGNHAFCEEDHAFVVIGVGLLGIGISENASPCPKFMVI